MLTAGTERIDEREEVQELFQNLKRAQLKLEHLIRAIT
jgi:hypothetical protein